MLEALFACVLGGIGILLVLILLVVLYYGMSTYFEGLKLKNIPEPPCTSLLQGHFETSAMEHDWFLKMRRWVETYSPIFRIRSGLFGYAVICCHPDTIRAIMMRNDPKSEKDYSTLEDWLGGSILLTNGKKWQRSRKLLTPAFHLDILKDYMPVYNECVRIMVDKWTAAIDETPRRVASVEVYGDIKQLTLDILMRCIFSQKTDCQTTRNQFPYLEAVDSLTKLVCMRFTEAIYFFPFVFELIHGREFRRNCDLVHLYSKAVIKARKAQLLEKKNESESRETEADSEKSSSENGAQRKKIDFIDILLTSLHEDGSPVSDEEVQPEVDMFMFAGHDTSSASLSWLLYLLAAHPEAQQRCREEALQTLNEQDELQHSDLNQLTYTTCCIKESMRMFPPVSFISRSLDEPVTLPDGRVLPKGLSIQLAINFLHNNPLVWEQPDLFEPSRFEPENSASRSPHAFVPFSAGARNCIGQFFAMNILKTSVALLLSRFVFEIDVSKEHRFVHDIISRPLNGMHLIVKPFVRNN